MKKLILAVVVLASAAVLAQTRRNRKIGRAHV